MPLFSPALISDAITKVTRPNVRAASEDSDTSLSAALDKSLRVPLSDANTTTNKNGIVKSVTTASLLMDAAKVPAVKGVYLPRGPHPLEDSISSWLVDQSSEGFGQYSSVSLRSAKKKDIEQVASKVVASLPATIRDVLKEDAYFMAKILRELCPTAPFLRMSMEVIGKYGCSRWHQDNYVGRMIVTYSGPGTWCADDDSVAYDQFKKTMMEPSNVSDPLIIPCFEKVHQTPTNSILLMKGNNWPGITGVRDHKGLTHKSPNVERDSNGEPVMNRLLLKVDLASRPFPKCTDDCCK